MEDFTEEDKKIQDEERHFRKLHFGFHNLRADGRSEEDE